MGGTYFWLDILHTLNMCSFTNFIRVLLKPFQTCRVWKPLWMLWHHLCAISHAAIAIWMLYFSWNSKALLSLSQVSGPSNTLYSVYEGKIVAEIVAFTFSTCLFCQKDDAFFFRKKESKRKIQWVDCMLVLRRPNLLYCNQEEVSWAARIRVVVKCE